MTRSKYEFWKEASLSQKLSAKFPEFCDYAGSEPRVSKKIAQLRILGQHGILDLENSIIKLAWDLLNEERKALFATSERTNEITKMGLQMPKGEDIISSFDEEE